MNAYPQYQYHKIVNAFKILRVCSGITPKNEGSHPIWNIWPVDHDLDPVEVDAVWMDRNKVDAGGYIVFYADGYMSYSPAKAFEDGYKLVTKKPDSKFDVFMRRFMLALIYLAIAAGVGLLLDNLYQRFQDANGYSFIDDKTGATCIVVNDGGNRIMDCIPAAPKTVAPQTTKTTIIETEGLFMPESRT